MPCGGRRRRVSRRAISEPVPDVLGLVALPEGTNLSEGRIPLALSGEIPYI